MSNDRKTAVSEESIVQIIARAARIGGRAAQKFGIELGIGDDASVWRPKKGFDVVLTTDWFLEDTHFWRDWHPAEAVGWKCLMRAASDIAATGAEPGCFLLSLALPKNCTGKWLTDFLRGMMKASRKLSCPLAGGDTTRSNRVMINISVAGGVSRGRAVRRSGAKPGDRIFVSGRLGEAELGLRLAGQLRKERGGRRSLLLKKHLYPEARVQLGKWLMRASLASAMMDISDGLSSDLTRLCAASRVGAEIDRTRIPCAGAAFLKKLTPEELNRAALHGGDDYELLFCVANRDRYRVPPAFHGLPLTEIGRISKTHAIKMTEKSGKTVPLLPQGWDPF